ncbi:MAG: NACHT domain-containing protein [Deltaproteobacteria bacterium]|nr:NACHT domain-containing protein [Deltaproteobacteria bacterium]
MKELLNFWSSTLKRDLPGFADPGTDPIVEVTRDTIASRWIQRGRDRAEKFRLTRDQDFRWLKDDHKPSTYSQFLSSEAMADFEQLASALLRGFPPEPYYVPTAAVNFGDAENNEQTGDSSQVLLASVTQALDLEKEAGRTTLVFLKGDAGSGKTTLLRECTRAQADRYRKGEESFLFLYVSAKGRALSNLRDALAGELQDLRAGFTRDAVPALVRNRLIVPIVDGFDELLGAAGYGDAFGSLQQLLMELEGLGVLIVAARSSFYDVEFLPIRPENIASASASAFQLQPIGLLPWGASELQQYILKVRSREDIGTDDQRALEHLSASDRRLLGKPFFASIFPSYVDSQRRRELSLTAYLVESYIVREAEKIVDRDGKPLVTPDQHQLFFREAAEFMWSNESRNLTQEELATLAEIVADEADLNVDAAKQFVTKITSYAGFKAARSGAEQRFQFEHEIYFDYFLAEMLRIGLKAGRSLDSFLDRGLLAEEVIRICVDKESSMAWLDRVQSIPRRGVLQDNRRRNAGAIAAQCFVELSHIVDREFSTLSFVHCHFGNTQFKNVKFDACSFIDVHFEGTYFENCSSTGCSFESLVVSNNTHIDIEGLQPGQNVFSLTVAGENWLFSPSDIRDALRRVSAPIKPEEDLIPKYTSRGASVVRLLQRLAQVYRRTNLVCLQDENLRGIFRDKHWRVLRAMLTTHGILSEERREASGNPKTFLRPQVRMKDLMKYELNLELPDNNFGAFWNELRQL